MKRAKTFLATSLGLALLVSITACSEDDPVSSNGSAIPGSGNLTTDVRTVAAFHSLDLSTVGEVNVSQGIAQAVSVTVDDNIQQYITTAVTGGVLEVSTTPGVQISNFDLTVDLTMVDIQSLAVSGVGSVESAHQLQIDTLDLDLAGTASAILNLTVAHLRTVVGGVGTVVLNGSVTSHDFTVGGESTLDAFGLTTDTTRVGIAGICTAELRAAEVLDVTISGNGMVSYKGAPSISVDITGIGQLINAN